MTPIIDANGTLVAKATEKQARKLLLFNYCRLILVKDTILLEHPILQVKGEWDATLLDRIDNIHSVTPSPDEIQTFKVLNFEGKVASENVTSRVAFWHIRNGIATTVDSETIQLTKKGDFLNLLEDHFGAFAAKKCVVCGLAGRKRLTRHHIVPLCFFKYFNKPACNQMAGHDIVWLCQKCHHNYEELAVEHKQRLFKIHASSEIYHKLKLRDKAYSALDWLKKNYTNSLTLDEKQIKFRQQVVDYFGHDEIHLLPGNDSFNWCRFILSKITNYQEFVEDWRAHFVQHMKPQFLPQKWNVQKKVPALIIHPTIEDK